MSLKLCACILSHSVVSDALQHHRLQTVVVISSSRNLPDPGIKPTPPVSLALAGGFFTTGLPGKARHL